MSKLEDSRSYLRVLGGDNVNLLRGLKRFLGLQSLLGHREKSGEGSDVGGGIRRGLRNHALNMHLTLLQIQEIPKRRGEKKLKPAFSPS